MLDQIVHYLYERLMTSKYRLRLQKKVGFLYVVHDIRRNMHLSTTPQFWDIILHKINNEFFISYGSSLQPDHTCNAPNFVIHVCRHQVTKINVVNDAGTLILNGTIFTEYFKIAANKFLLNT